MKFSQKKFFKKITLINNIFKIIFLIIKIMLINKLYDIILLHTIKTLFY